MPQKVLANSLFCDIRKDVQRGPICSSKLGLTKLEFRDGKNYQKTSSMLEITTQIFERKPSTVMSLLFFWDLPNTPSIGIFDIHLLPTPPVPPSHNHRSNSWRALGLIDFPVPRSEGRNLGGQNMSPKILSPTRMYPKLEPQAKVRSEIFGLFIIYSLKSWVV